MDTYENRMRQAALQYYKEEQIRYMMGFRSVWGYGEHRMAEFARHGHRRLKHYV